MNDSLAPPALHGRIAARRSFVELKLCFMQAAAALGGVTGQHLQTLVRQSSEPSELWLLRSSLLAALTRLGESGHIHCTRVQLALQQVYPDRGRP